MKKNAPIITACLVILLFHVGLTSAFAAPMLEQIIFDTPGPDEDRITFKLNGAYLPRTFALEGDRPRVVLDFPEVSPAKKVKNTIQAKGTFIKSIRTGIHTGKKPKTRVVFDLQPGVQVDFDRNFDKDTNTLVIRVFAAGMILDEITAEQEEPDQEVVPKEAEAETPESVADVSPDYQEQTPPEPEVKTEKTTPVAPPPVAEKEETAIQQEEKAAPQETISAVSTPPTDMETEEKPGMEESTVIQPLSEIGVTEEKAAEKEVFSLNSVEFDDTSQRGEIVAFKLNAFNPPVVFGIEEDVPRIVCFFKDTSAGEKLDEFIESKGRFIKNIKIGKYRNPDNVRVVLDLVPGKNYDLQQIFFKEDNLFMIIINTTGEKAAK